MNIGNIIAALILAVGIAVGGFFVQDGLFNLRGAARSVEVRGLSERQVKADTAVWTIRHGGSDSDLTAAQAQVDKNAKALKAFFETLGIKNDEIRIGDGSVWEDRREMNGIFTTYYNVDQSFVIRTKNIESVEMGNQKIYDLVSSGVVLRSSTPRYIFSGLNTIKPDMIGEATKNAREAAARFAQDSGAQVGAILNANQGLFSIMPRDAGGNEDESQFIDKTVRVVTTVNFMIKD